MTEGSPGWGRGGVAEANVATGGEPAGPAPDDSRLRVLRELPRDASREAVISLLAATGRCDPYVRASCEAGQVFGFASIDAAACGPEGALVSVPTDAGRSAELRIVALAPGMPGVGAEMLSQFADCLRGRGFHRIVAMVSDAQLGLMRVLVDAGFRFLSVERDSCTPERGFAPHRNGRSPRHRDLVWLELEL